VLKTLKNLKSHIFSGQNLAYPKKGPPFGFSLRHFPQENFSSLELMFGKVQNAFRNHITVRAREKLAIWSQFEPGKQRDGGTSACGFTLVAFSAALAFSAVSFYYIADADQLFFIMYTQAHQSKSSKRVLKVAQTLKRTRPLLMCACQKRDGAETLCVDVRDSRTDRLISATVLMFCDSRATDKIWRQNVQNYYFGFSRQILAIQFVFHCSWAVTFLLL
jgi:hypothetical protein